MQKNINHTAIILFSRSAEKEATAKNFSYTNNFRFNKKVAQTLISKTVSLAKETKLPFYVVDETLQQGNCFGEKISNTIQDHFKKGYEHLIIIGNDCLALESEHILRAYRHLQNNETVAGATSKGGLYLIGINKLSFNKNDFQNIRWQTEFVFTDFKNLNSAIFLPVLGDANNHQELAHQLKLLARHNRFFKIIQSYFASFTILHLRGSEFIPQSALLLCSGLRAPPPY